MINDTLLVRGRMQTMFNTRRPMLPMLPEANILKEFRLCRYRIIWTKKWKRCGPQWCVSYSHGAILFYNVTKRESSKVQDSSCTNGNLKVESKYMDAGPDLRNWTCRENVEDEWIFAAGLQHNQIKSGPSFKAPIGSAKLPRHILSNGQDELRILVEKAEYEAKSCFFTLARSSLKSRDFSWFFLILWVSFFKKWNVENDLKKKRQETRRFTFRMVLKWLNPATLVAYALFVVSEATWVGVRKFVPWRPSKREPWLMPWQAPPVPCSS